MNIADDDRVGRLIDLARREDLGTGDITSQLLPDPQAPAAFRLVAREEGVFAGQPIAPAVLAAYDEAIELEWSRTVSDGCTCHAAPVELATIRGPVGAILSAERVLLNFLQRLCGIATITRRFVDAVAGTGCDLYDTRKTTPGWRVLEKYAVRCGGGCNHRFGLFDAVLIKDNHLAHLASGPQRRTTAGAVFEMLDRLSATGASPAFVEVEVRNVREAEEIFKVVGISVVLLDNFTLADLRAAVALRDGLGLRGKVVLEASGGVTLETVRTVAQTGVERISVGALTHSSAALDLALERV